MTTAQCIAIASKPDTHIVLGVRLKPFCVGHWMTLCANDAAFFSNHTPQLSDLIFSVLVCSESYEGFNATIDSGDFGKSIRRWAYRLSGGFVGVWKRRWKRITGRPLDVAEICGFNYQDELAKFQSYLDEMGATPHVVNKWARPVTKHIGESSPANYESPEMVLIVNFLTSEMGFSESAALNMPLPLARWKIATHAERKGSVRIVNVDEEKIEQERANKFAEDYFAGRVQL